MVVANLEDALSNASRNRFKLIVIRRCSDIETDFDVITLNQLLGRELVGLARVDRAKELAHLFSELLSSLSTEVIMVMGIEILFDRSLAVDPLRLLKEVARNKTLLACWPGEMTNGGLAYAIPSHPEYRNYRRSDLSDVILLDDGHTVQ